MITVSSYTARFDHAVTPRTVLRPGMIVRTALSPDARELDGFRRALRDAGLCAGFVRAMPRAEMDVWKLRRGAGLGGPRPPAAALFAAVGGSRAASLRVWDAVAPLGYPLPADYAGRAPSVDALAFLVGVPARTWRRWAAGDTRMPLAAQRLVATVAGLECLEVGQ